MHATSGSQVWSQNKGLVYHFPSSNQKGSSSTFTFGTSSHGEPPFDAPPTKRPPSPVGDGAIVGEERNNMAPLSPSQHASHHCNPKVTTIPASQSIRAAGDGVKPYQKRRRPPLCSEILEPLLARATPSLEATPLSLIAATPTVIGAAITQPTQTFLPHYFDFGSLDCCVFVLVVGRDGCAGCWGKKLWLWNWICCSMMEVR